MFMVTPLTFNRQKEPQLLITVHLTEKMCNTYVTHSQGHVEHLKMIFRNIENLSRFGDSTESSVENRIFVLINL